jgi:hypothetical protein
VYNQGVYQPGILDKKKQRELLALLQNPLFQEQVLSFRSKWNIPMTGFPEVGEPYKEWVLRYNEYSESIQKDFTKIASRCNQLYGRVDQIFRAILGMYLLFNKFIPSYPNELYLPSSLPKIKASGVLGYIDVILTVPLFFTFTDLLDVLESTEGLLSSFSTNMNTTVKNITKPLNSKPSSKKIENTFLPTVSGNPAVIVATTQENIEYLVEYGRNLLRESVSRLKTTKVATYEDKNRHINDSIRQMGMFLSTRGLYNISEIYWVNITEETKQINKKLKLNPPLNMGISLANTGVYQLAQGKVEEGLFNLYSAHEEDRRILEQLQHRETDPSKNLVSSILYTQFEQIILAWLYDSVIQPFNSLCVVFPSKEQLNLLFSETSPIKRIQLFGIVSSFKQAISQESELSNSISRRTILNAFSDLGIWIEDETKKTNPSAGYLFNTFQEILNFSGFTTGSTTLDQLEGNLQNLESSVTNQDEINAKTTILIRNFSEHNFNCDSHNFFSKTERYLARVFFSLFFLKMNTKI